MEVWEIVLIFKYMVLVFFKIEPFSIYGTKSRVRLHFNIGSSDDAITLNIQMKCLAVMMSERSAEMTLGTVWYISQHLLI